VKGNGFDFCGFRQYSIVSAPSTSAVTALSTDELTIDATTGLITVYSTDSATVGTHTATVTATLANYPTVTSASASFSIQINACIVTAFTMASLSAQTYTIGSFVHTWTIDGSLVTTQVPACEYSFTLTGSTTSAIVTATPGATISYSVYSRDVTNADTLSISVSATLDNYPYGAPTPPCLSTFTLTIADPCTSTSITIAPASIENLIAFAGYTVVSKAKYTFNDAVSISRTLSTDSVDFCGAKELLVTLNGTAGTYFTVSNANYMYFSPPGNTNDYGVG
jgi:hypothetical protein